MNSAASGALQIERAGPLATLQDAGRFGVRRLGVTQGGAADLHAFAWTNHLLGNAWNTAALEVVLGGLTLVAEQDTWLALGGADLQARLGDKPLAPWQTFNLPKGERLSFGSPAAGVRAYLAVPGGFQGEPVLGSLSCVIREGLGGHDGEGRSLAKDERLMFSLTKQHVTGESRGISREVPLDQRLDYRQPAVLSLIPGAQIADFSGDSLFRTFSHAWRVDTRADRMGVRFTGPVLQCRHHQMISEGIALGAVQVPPDGQPIVLLNDRQTIGGYPRLGTLTPLACARLAQCQPGEHVTFSAVGLEQAQEAYRHFRQAFS